MWQNYTTLSGLQGDVDVCRIGLRFSRRLLCIGHGDRLYLGECLLSSLPLSFNKHVFGFTAGGTSVRRLINVVDVKIILATDDAVGWSTNPRT